MAKGTKSMDVSTIQLAPESAIVAIRRLVDVNLKLASKFKKRQGIMLWGQPGAGKSDLIFQIAATLDYDVIDLRLNQIDSVDLRGIPATHVVDESTGELTVRWAVPEIFPRITDPKTGFAKIEKPKHMWKDENTPEFFKGAFIFLDEITNAPGLVQTSAYQLVLDAMLGEYKVPSNVVVIAAGNRETDRSNAQRMATALANRFTHIELKVEVKGWTAWALENNVNKTIVSFVAGHPEVMDFDSTSGTSSRAFCTPRSAVALSNIMDEDDLRGVPDDVKRVLIHGTIGTAAGAKLVSHLDSIVALPDPHDILSGKITNLTDKLPAALQRHVVYSLCYLIRDVANDEEANSRGLDKVNKYVDVYLNFVEKNFHEEIVMVSIHTLMKNFSIKFESAKVPGFSTIAKKYVPLLRSQK